MPKWHRDSIFGEGPRRPLCRERKARYYYLLKAHRQVRHITPLGEHVGVALVRRLSTAGQCDPSHDTIAEDVACSPRTVRRALVTLKALGLIMWQRRIVRSGACVDQVSNAYLLLTPDGNPSDGQNGQRTFQKKKNTSSFYLSARELTDEEMDAAARISAQQQMLQLTGGVMPRSWGVR